MPLDIKHPEKPTEANKIDDNDFMASHVITGKLPYSSVDIGSGIPKEDIDYIPDLIGYELLEKKEVSSVSEATFNNLDGDNDEEYLIDFDLTINCPDGNAQSVHILPNNQSGDYYRSTMDYCDYKGAFSNINNWLGNIMIIGGCGWGGTSRVKGKAEFNTKRTILIDVISKTVDLKDSTHWSKRNFHSVYTKIDTNITSLVIKTSATSFTGKIALYRKVNY